MALSSIQRKERLRVEQNMEVVTIDIELYNIMITSGYDNDKHSIRYDSLKYKAPLIIKVKNITNEEAKIKD